MRTLMYILFVLNLLFSIGNGFSAYYSFIQGKFMISTINSFVCGFTLFAAMAIVLVYKDKS